MTTPNQAKANVPQTGTEYPPGTEEWRHAKLPRAAVSFIQVIHETAPNKPHHLCSLQQFDLSHKAPWRKLTIHSTFLWLAYSRQRDYLAPRLPFCRDASSLFTAGRVLAASPHSSLSSCRNKTLASHHLFNI